MAKPNVLAFPWLGLGVCMVLAGCASSPKSERPIPPEARPQSSVAEVPRSPPEAWVVGTWGMDVGDTVAVLARAQFGTQTVVTVKAGAPHPVTNMVHKPFDQKTYDRSRAEWEKGLAAMGWQLRFNPDHSGEHVSRASTNAPTVSPFEWQVLDRTLRLDYVREKRFRYFTCRIVSSNELHYPMQPLGGYLVLRRSR